MKSCCRRTQDQVGRIPTYQQLGSRGNSGSASCAQFPRHNRNFGDLNSLGIGVILKKRPDEIEKAKRLDGRGFQLFLSSRFRSESQGAYEAKRANGVWSRQQAAEVLWQQ